MYTEPITFSSTNNYGKTLNKEDDVYTVEEFLNCVKTGLFIDYDGFGYPVKDKLADKSIMIKPSKVFQIPDDATHIVWFNR
jgi:hypothetical protein